MIKWMQHGGEKPLTEEEAMAEYERTEKGIRYQLLESKLIEQHGIKIEFEDLKEFSTSLESEFDEGLYIDLKKSLKEVMST